MAQELPTWLDDAFLATVLQGGEGKEPLVEIIKFSSKSAVGPGNNYSSTMLRVQVEYKVEQTAEQQSLSLIVKAPILKGALYDLSENTNFFTKEPKMYNELLPKMYEKIKYKFGPNSYYCPMKLALVLEDLKQEGYVMCDRLLQLDFSHCKFVYETLGKFHATSVACHLDNAELVEEIGDEPFYKKAVPLEEEFKCCLEASVKQFLETCKTLDGQKLATDFISSKTDHLWESLVNICKPKRGCLNVLNHGDCWTSNMLFKHNDSGEVIDVKLIDFQILRYASPVIDLIYFMWTSANEDVRENRQEELYRIYTQTLNKTLEELGCEERLTFKDLQEDLKSATDWIVVAISYRLPYILCDSENTIDFGNHSTEDLKSNNSLLQQVYSSHYYRERLPAILRQFKSTVS